MSAAACPMAATLAGADTVGTALTSEMPAATRAPSTIERIPSSLSNPRRKLSRSSPGRNNDSLWRPSDAAWDRCRRLRSATARRNRHRARKQTRVVRLARVSVQEFIEKFFGHICRKGWVQTHRIPVPCASLNALRPPTSHAQSSLSKAPNQPHTAACTSRTCCWRDAMRLARLVVCVATTTLVILEHAVPSALARDNGQWESSPPHVRKWFQGLRQPDNPRVSCCGEADAYEADIFEVGGGGYIAVITDGKGDIPNGTKNRRAQSQDKMGRGKPDGARHHLHRHPGAGLLLRGPRRGVTILDPWLARGFVDRRVRLARPLVPRRLIRSSRHLPCRPGRRKTL